MKFLHFLMVLFTAGIFLSSCQKEYSSENGNSIGSLQSDAIGDCMPILVNGLYITDTAMKASNYVEVQVNFSQSGAYLIKTDTINGYSFTGSGSVSVAGVSTVRLQGFGKPVAPSTADIFQVVYQTSACDFSVTVTATGGGGGTTSAFTFGGSPGACTGAAINGTYTEGTATGAANTAVINVNVTTPGTYTLTTGAVNGVTFAGTGILAAGAQTITLTATGTPTAAGPITYPISAGSSNCSFTVTYSAAAPPATYTIDCTGATQSGTYHAGTATTSGNTVTISATSTGPGSYNITTPVVNGVSFSGSGSFPSGTTQPITLTATGTPTGAGTFAYTATAATGGSTCTFSVTFTAAPPGPAQFITATVGGVSKTFNTNITASFSTVSGAADLQISGENTAGDEFMDFAVALAGTTIPAGTYNVNTMTYFVDGNYESSTGDIYSANTLSANPTPAFSVTVSNVTTTSTTATGTFTGALKDGLGNVIQITNGAFSVNL